MAAPGPRTASANLPTPPALSNVPDTEREAFRMLRANLRYFSLSRDIRSLLITSSDPGDGKSTVAWGLTVAAARKWLPFAVTNASLL